MAHGGDRGGEGKRSRGGEDLTAWRGGAVGRGGCCEWKGGSMSTCLAPRPAPPQKGDRKGRSPGVGGWTGAEVGQGGGGATAFNCPERELCTQNNDCETCHRSETGGKGKGEGNIFGRKKIIIVIYNNNNYIYIIMYNNLYNNSIVYKNSDILDGKLGRLDGPNSHQLICPRKEYAVCLKIGANDETPGTNNGGEI